jgi:hypothetical protein
MELDSTLTPIRKRTWVLPELAVEIVKTVLVLWAVLGYNARLSLWVVVANASAVTRRPRGPSGVMMHLRQLVVVLAPTQASLRVQFPVVQPAISRRPQTRCHTLAPSHDAAYRIAVRGRAVPHDEAQHSLVSPW